jgi:hypothetical protein
MKRRRRRRRRRRRKGVLVFGTESLLCGIYLLSFNSLRQEINVLFLEVPSS